MGLAIVMVSRKNIVVRARAEVVAHPRELVTIT